LAKLIARAVGFNVGEVAHCQLLKTPWAAGVDPGKIMLFFHTSDIGSVRTVPGRVNKNKDTQLSFDIQ